MPKISMISAMDKQRGIGRDNQMAWHLPADLKHFKAFTTGKPVLMGSKTYRSLPPLPGRTMIVLSRQEKPKDVSDSVYWVCTVQDAFTLADSMGFDELVVIGGGQIYKECLPYTDVIWLTEIDIDGHCDTFFPKLPEVYQLRSINEGICDENNKHPHRFKRYVRE